MRPIIFLIKDPNCTASTQCGVVLNHALKSVDINSSIKYDVDGIKNSIVVIFKHIISDKEIDILKKNDNKIVMDVVDEFIRPNTNVLDLYDYSKLDGVISRVKKVIDIYQFPLNLNITYIPHHWDIRLQDQQTRNKITNYKPALISNDLRDMPYLEYLYTNYLVDFHTNFGFDSFNSYIDMFSKYDIHYNVRNTDSLAYKFKPATKLVTAAAFNTPLITNYDWALQDLIPEDYPFLIKNPSIESINNTINNLSSISSNDLNYTLEILKEVKYKTALVTLVSSYIDFFKQF
jgi:hypothetical protein